MYNKMKSPLRAFFLSLALPGLGHIYLGRSLLGAGLFLLVGLPGAGSIVYVLNPATKVNPFFIIPLVFSVCCYLFSMANAYYIANKYNLTYGLTGDISTKTRVAINFGIMVFVIFYLFLARFISVNLFHSFIVPPDSMEPTIYSGERVLVNFMAYKVAGPQRGDIVIYRYPSDPSKIYIHRIIAFPGESVELKDHKIYINGTMLTAPWAVKVRHYNGGKLAKKGMKPVVVDPGTYYVLGDNAARSEDSRVWGFLPGQNIIGKVYKIFSPFERSGPVE